MSSDANGEAISPCRVTIRIDPAEFRREGREDAAAPGPDRGIRETSRRRSGNRETADDLEQVLGSQPLEPERSPPGGIGTGHRTGPGPRSGGSAARRARSQAAPGGSGAPPRRRSGRRADRAAAHPFRQPKESPSSPCRHAGMDAETLADAAEQGELQSLVHPAAKWGKNRQANTRRPGRGKVSTRIVRSSGRTPATRAWRAI